MFFKHYLKGYIIIGIFMGLSICHFVAPFPYSMTLPLAFLTLCAFLLHKRGLMLALFFSFLGDVMGYQGAFIPQMLFFALTQLIYIQLFRPVKVQGSGKYFMIAFVSVLWVVMMALLAWNVQDRILLLPMGIYAILLLTMFTYASLQKNIMLLIAALLFVLSDSMIAINKFMVHIPHAHYYIMITYYLAQLGIFQTMVVKKQKI